LLIRAMTYNVLTTEIAPDEVQDPNDVWSYRADLNVRTIRRYEPHIIGFQEFDDGHRRTYQEHLGAYDCFDPGMEKDTPEGSGLAVYWNKEMFRPLDAGKFWLCRDPSKPSRDWGLDYAMPAAWVRLECQPTGAPLVFLNTHYDLGFRGQEMQREGTRIVLEQLEKIASGVPTVVAGDFNCNPWSYPYRLYMGAGFVDAYRAAGHGDGAHSTTYHGFRGAQYFALEWGVELNWRIDWMLLRAGPGQRFQTTSCTIARDAAPPVYASDPYPVVSITGPAARTFPFFI
jgi:endonuclease/exonuclease/phosphatase family metal-dependent hydrolase